MRRYLAVWALGGAVACDDVDAISRCHEDACAPGCATNLIANPGFEVDTDGWFGVNGQLTRVSGGHRGGFAAHVCKTTPAVPDYTAQSAVIGVPQPPAVGVRLQLDAWLRDATFAQTAGPIIREDAAGGGYVGDSGPHTITLSPDWQKVTTSYSILQASSPSIDVYMEALDTPDGACFDFDDVCLRTTN